MEFCGKWMHAVKKVCVGEPLKTVARGAGCSGGGWLDINHLVGGVFHSFHPQPWLGAVGIYTLSYPPQNSAKLILLVWLNPSAVRPHYKRNRWSGLFLEVVPAFPSRPVHCCGYVSARPSCAMLKLRLLYLLRGTSTKLCILQFSADPVAYFFPSPYIFLITLVSKFPRQGSSLNTKDQVLQIRQTAGRTVVTQAMITYDVKCKYIFTCYVRKNGGYN